VLGYPAKSVIDGIRKELTERIARIPGVGKVNLDVQVKIVPHAVQRGLKLLAGVKNVIAVASGKGGVGKIHDRREPGVGARCGRRQGRNYWTRTFMVPSQQMMMGLSGKPMSPERQVDETDGEYGVQAIVHRTAYRRRHADGLARTDGDPGAGTIAARHAMEGPGLPVVDCRPETGRYPATLSQKVPVTGAVIVTTPQDIALIDARKGLKMFEKVGVPILGLVENMSVHICSNCGTKSTSLAKGALHG
jgi:ATP-binding protein involved in chromosome partitioning